MPRIILLIIAAYYVGLAALMWFLAQTWYDTTPGVAMMGPFNLHFIRDVALIYLVSGAAIGGGVLKGGRSAAFVGASWPALHGLFHLWIWVGRGLPFDLIAAVNLAGIQVPAWLALFLIIRAWPQHPSQ